MFTRFARILLIGMAVLLALPLIAYAHLDSAEIHANIETLVDEVFNKGNVDVIDEFYAEDYVGYPDMSTRDDFKADAAALRAAIPDLHASVSNAVVDDEWAAFRFSMTGTFTNPLTSPQGDLPPTGKPVMLNINIFLHMNEDGIVIEDWEYIDNLSWLMQLGVIPAPENAPAGDAAVMEPMMTEEAPMMDSDMTDANRTSNQGVFDAINARDFDAVAAFFAPDYVQHAPSAEFDLAGLTGEIMGLQAAAPDFMFTVENIVAEGNIAAVRFTGKGTFTEPLAAPDGSSLPPTNAAIEIPSSLILRFDENGKIAEAWEAFDNLAFLMQIGAIPAMEGTS
jgi:predicted ester cyclase